MWKTEPLHNNLQHWLIAPDGKRITYLPELDASIIAEYLNKHTSFKE